MRSITYWSGLIFGMWNNHVDRELLIYSAYYRLYYTYHVGCVEMCTIRVGNYYIYSIYITYTYAHAQHVYTHAMLSMMRAASSCCLHALALPVYECTLRVHIYASCIIDHARSSMHMYIYIYNIRHISRVRFVTYVASSQYNIVTKRII